MRARPALCMLIAALLLAMACAARHRPQPAGPSAPALSLMHRMPEKAKREALADLVARFEGLHPGLVVKVEYVEPIDYDSLLKGRITEGEAPDIIYGRAAAYADLVRAGQLLELGDLRDSRQDGALASEIVDGRLWGFPLDISVQGLYYNRRVFLRLGLEPPRSWAELRAACDAAKEAGILPLAAGLRDKWPLVSLYWPDMMGNLLLARSDWRGRAMARSLRFADDPGIRAAWERFALLIDYCGDQAWDYDYATSIQLLTTGLAAMAVYSSDSLPEIEAYDKEGAIGFLPFPSSLAGTRGELVAGAGDSFMLSAQTREPALAREFIAFLARADSEALWTSRARAIGARRGAAIDATDPLLASLGGLLRSATLVDPEAGSMFVGEFGRAFAGATKDFAATKGPLRLGLLPRFLSDLDARFDAAARAYGPVSEGPSAGR